MLLLEVDTVSIPGATIAPHRHRAIRDVHQGMWPSHLDEDRLLIRRLCVRCDWISVPSRRNLHLLRLIQLHPRASPLDRMQRPVLRAHWHTRTRIPASVDPTAPHRVPAQDTRHYRVPEVLPIPTRDAAALDRPRHCTVEQHHPLHQRHPR